MLNRNIVRFGGFGFALALCALGLPAFAQDSTAEALKAKRVKDFIRLQSFGSGDDFRLQYQRDDKTDDSFRNLTAQGFGTSFLSSDGMQLRFRSFNPLRYSLAVEVEELDDENFKALEQIVDALLNLGQSIEGASETKESLPEENDSRRAAVVSECLQVQNLHKALADLLSILQNKLVKQEEIKAWVDGAKKADGTVIHEGALGYDGVHMVRAEINTKIKATQAAIKEAEKNLKSIINVRASANSRNHAARSGSAAECDAAIATAIQLSLAVSLTYKDSIEGMRTLLDSLKRLDAVLEPYDFDEKNRIQEKWALDENNKRNDYIVMPYDPKEGKRTEVELTLIRRDLKRKGDTIEFEDREAVSTSLSLRKYSTIVPEIGAGLLWSDLKIARYGTEEVGGQTQLVLAREDKLGSQATLVGNFLFRTGGDSFVHPGLQIGVGTGEETPALIYGVVLRFTAPKHVSVSFGGVTTWTRQLDKLKIGDSISGTAELEADLDRKSESDTYIGIQYNWSLGKN